MKLLLSLSLLAMLLSACVSTPAGGPGADSGTSPRPTTGAAGATDATDVPPPTDATMEGPFVSTSLPPSTVVLSELKTETPAPLPATGADVTVDQSMFDQSITLKPGQTLAVLLDLDTWDAPVFDAGVLRALPWTGPLPATHTALLFEAVAAGKTDLSVQTLLPPCPPPGGGPCSRRPIKLFTLHVAVTQ